MLLNSALLLLRERPSVLKGLWAIYLERETKSFSPFLLLWSYKWQLFEKQSWRGPNLFRSSRKKAWALTLGLWGRRSSTRDSAILIRELDEALQKTSSLSKLFNLFFLLFNGCWTKNEWMWRIIVCTNESAYQYHSFIFIFQLFFWRTIHFTFLKNVQTSLHSICIQYSITFSLEESPTFRNESWILSLLSHEKVCKKIALFLYFLINVMHYKTILSNLTIHFPLLGRGSK